MTLVEIMILILIVLGLFVLIVTILFWVAFDYLRRILDALHLLAAQEADKEHSAQ